jgi:hypothetical protein
MNRFCIPGSFLNNLSVFLTSSQNGQYSQFSEKKSEAHRSKQHWRIGKHLVESQSKCTLQLSSLEKTGKENFSLCLNTLSGPKLTIYLSGLFLCGGECSTKWPKYSFFMGIKQPDFQSPTHFPSSVGMSWHATEGTHVMEFRRSDSIPTLPSDSHGTFNLVTSTFCASIVSFVQQEYKNVLHIASWGIKNN